MKRRLFLTMLAVGSASLGLAGCGFRLRGLNESLAIPEGLAFEGTDDALSPVVRETLEQAGTRLDGQAPLRLNLGRERIEEYSLSFGGAGSKELELRLTAPFSVQRREDDAYLLDQQQLDVTTTVIVNDDNLLAQDDLRDEARQRLRRDAANQLLDRLRPLTQR